MNSPSEGSRNPVHALDSPPVIDLAPRIGDAGPVPTVIFFHGRGLDEGTVEQVADGFRCARILAPRGPIAKRRGYTWFENERIGVADPASAQAAVSYVEAWLDRTVPQGTKLWLCGFSNGGALVSRPRGFDRLIPDGIEAWQIGRIDQHLDAAGCTRLA